VGECEGESGVREILLVAALFYGYGAFKGSKGTPVSGMLRGCEGVQWE
jgi:hypothetical protein